MPFLSIDPTDMYYSRELCFAGAACDLRTNSPELYRMLEGLSIADSETVPGGFRYVGRCGRVIRRSCRRASFSRIAPRRNSIVWRFECVRVRHPATHPKRKRLGRDRAGWSLLEGEADSDYARNSGRRDRPRSGTLRVPGDQMAMGY